MTPEAQAILDTTPGGILLREFFQPLGLKQSEVAERTSLPASRINAIVKGHRAITAETAIAFGAFFRNSPQFWLNLQTGCDLRRAELLDAERIRSAVRPLEVA